MSNNSTQFPTPEQYILVALIDICRGLKVRIPEDLSKKTQSNVLKDVLSSAISYAEEQESMQVISEELFRCAKEGCTLQNQMEILPRQSPDVINAKMVAASYLLKLANKEQNLM